MRRRKTVFTRLFSSFLLLAFVTVFLCMGGFYLFSAHMIRESTADELSRSAQGLGEQLDSILLSMDQLSLQTIAEKNLARQFYAMQDAAAAGDGSATQAQASRISTSLYSILGAWISRGREINILSASGDFIGTNSMAVYRRLGDKPESLYPWIEPTLALRGARYVTSVHPCPWSPSHELVFSLTRTLPRNQLLGSNSDAVLEIQQSYGYICDEIADLCGSATQAVIMAADGSLLYPYDAEEGEYTALFKMAGQNGRSMSVRLGEDESPYIASAVYSSYSGWTTFVLESEHDYLAPLSKLRQYVIAISAALLAAVLALSYYAAKEITTPLREINERIASMSLNNLTTDDFSGGGTLDELEQLRSAFHLSCQRLEASLSEVVSARSYEMQARMLALQSQMNPHFIYNVISNICAVAEDHEEDEIAGMCTDLSGMLRYAISAGTESVPLSQEFRHTENYLRLMKRRFEEKLQYELSATEEAQACIVPKLIVQPLAENFFKHGGGLPLWRIRITAFTKDGSWFVICEDNGAGFSAEVQSRLERELAQTDENHAAVWSENGSGIGLRNIASRLRLSCGAQASITLGRSEFGGALVQISGKIEAITDG